MNRKKLLTYTIIRDGFIYILATIGVSIGCCIGYLIMTALGMF